jgi:uncharacterized repeat protein (TIGR01451 family)
LYVLDDTAGDAGSISSGWSLALTTDTPLRSFADLAVGMTSTPASLLVGGTLTNTIWVTNLGPATATGVMLTNKLSSGQQFVTSIGSMAENATTNVMLLITTSLAGNITNTASLGGNEADLNLANNSIQTSTSVVAPAPAKLTGSIVGGQFELVVNAQPGFVYAIQGSTNLTSWVSLSTNTASPGGTIKFTDTNAPNFKRRFYRAQHLVP